MLTPNRSTGHIIDDTSTTDIGIAESDVVADRLC
jgi:hypothetical protein